MYRSQSRVIAPFFPQVTMSTITGMNINLSMTLSEILFNNAPRRWLYLYKEHHGDAHGRLIILVGQSECPAVTRSDLEYRVRIRSRPDSICAFLINFELCRYLFAELHDDDLYDRTWNAMLRSAVASANRTTFHAASNSFRPGVLADVTDRRRLLPHRTPPTRRIKASATKKTVDANAGATRARSSSKL